MNRDQFAHVLQVAAEHGADAAWLVAQDYTLKFKLGQTWVSQVTAAEGPDVSVVGPAAPRPEGFTLTRHQAERVLHQFAATTHKDYGCRFCVGDDLINSSGFVCVMHQIKHWLASADYQKIGESLGLSGNLIVVPAPADAKPFSEATGTVPSVDIQQLSQMGRERFVDVPADAPRWTDGEPSVRAVGQWLWAERENAKPEWVAVLREAAMLLCAVAPQPEMLNGDEQMELYRKQRYEEKTILTRAGWLSLINGNIEWVKAQERTLERDHVLEMLEWARTHRAAFAAKTKEPG